MTEALDILIAQLENYSKSAQEQIDIDADQAAYWRGVRFGVELALLEARKQQVAPSSADRLYEPISKLVFERFEKLIELCQTRIPRDLLTYNARLARYELLKAIRQQSNSTRLTDYERQANPDTPLDL